MHRDFEGQIFFGEGVMYLIYCKICSFTNSILTCCCNHSGSSSADDAMITFIWRYSFKYDIFYYSCLSAVRQIRASRRGGSKKQCLIISLSRIFFKILFEICCLFILCFLILTYQFSIINHS